MAKRHASMLEELLRSQAKEVRKGKPRKKSELPPTPGMQWTCGAAGCEEVMTSLAACTRHSRIPGHGRAALVL